MVRRSDSNRCMIWTKPVPSAPTRLRTGTRTSSKDSSAVSEHHHPIFFRRDDTVKPGRSVSTTSKEIPACPGPPVRTAVVTKSARTPEVMKVLAPEIT